MGTILKATVRQKIWNRKTEKYEVIDEELTADQSGFKLEWELLNNISDHRIAEYAEDNLDMIDESECKRQKRLENYQEWEIIDFLEDQGYRVVKCKTINDESKFQQLKQIMEL
ncbi:hypothetical protein E0K83_03810 [Gramella sp. BOM4]|nr:hypothetical protein [Christiangramia bathymodioli]